MQKRRSESHYQVRKHAKWAKQAGERALSRQIGVQLKLLDMMQALSTKRAFITNSYPITKSLDKEGNVVYQ